MSAGYPWSRYARVVAVGAQTALALALILRPPLGWLAGLYLMLPLPWMLRGSAYAHALNSLLILLPMAGLLVFADAPSIRPMALLAALAFLGSVFYVRWSAVERRAALAARTESSDGAAPPGTPDPEHPGP